MKPYKHILVAVDLSQDSKRVLDCGLELAKRYQAKISLIHVVEPAVLDISYDLMISLPLELDSLLLERAKKYMEGLLSDLKIDQVENKAVVLGSVKNEVFNMASHHSVDLIVLGTHGRHGVGLLLGSTANSILHGAPCDVHIVKIRA